MANHDVLTGTNVEKALQIQKIPFKASSPRKTKRRIFVIENYPFLEAELMRLLEIGELHWEGIRTLRHRLNGNSKI